jgi:hypothetical protein
MTFQELQRGIDRDKNHYADLKDDKDFTNWNHGVVGTARKHHMDEVLEETFNLISASDIDMFKEKQDFMYAVLKVYRELKKYALSAAVR